MRRLVDAARLEDFLTALARESRADVRIYLTGGASAVLQGWRPSTVDIDLKIVPDSDAILRAIPRLKESLEINVELAAPDEFIPELPGWQERSPLIRREGRISFHHYDFSAQALAKLERGHDRDLRDAGEMARRGLIDPAALVQYFDQISPNMYRYPAIDPASFRRAVEDFVRGHSKL
ncbi:MAG: DUF6036 family nucleotidyltransferase [Thermoanaerobaculia bacterium]